MNDATGLGRCGWVRRGGRWEKGGAAHAAPSPLTPAEARLNLDLALEECDWWFDCPEHDPDCGLYAEDSDGTPFECSCGLRAAEIAVAATRALLFVADRLGCDPWPGAILAAVEKLCRAEGLT